MFLAHAVQLHGSNEADMMARQGCVASAVWILPLLAVGLMIHAVVFISCSVLAEAWMRSQLSEAQ